MRNKILILVIALVMTGGYAVYAGKQKQTKPEVIMETDDSMMKDEKMMDKDESSRMMKKGEYQAYSAETVSTAQAANQKVVLFFYAPWCPECRAADAVFKSQADKIPAGVSLLKTDYDHETELKEKYRVNYQHTFVQIDASGNAVTKWVSGDI